MKATKDMLIIELLEMDRSVAEVLMNAGMHCVGCMAARGESIEDACAVHGIDADKLIEVINKRLEAKE